MPDVPAFQRPGAPRALPRASRRAVLASGVGLAVALALCDAEEVRAAIAAAADGADSEYRYFTAAEAELVDALTAQIVPTDATPGAREAGVVRFIDRALASFFAPLAADLRAGLMDFERHCAAAHPERDRYPRWPADQQTAWLYTVDRTPLFIRLQELTVLGLLTRPDYGGNRDGIGWQLIGFSDQHGYAPPFGHYDRDYPGFGVATGETP
jgi:gluconate 2-dehydrogenase gamma chain